jgi:hypothetical protein
MSKFNQIISHLNKYRDGYTDEFVNYSDQAANDFIYSFLKERKTSGMISKFGTIELAICSFYQPYQSFAKKINEYFKGTFPISFLFNKKCFQTNAGFFPLKRKFMVRFSKLVIDDCQRIDILGSYRSDEINLSKQLSSSVKVNLDGLLCPFFWENPWTSALRGKKILVISPFASSIKEQYDNKRQMLFQNQDVLPEFSNLSTIQAIQSNGENAKECGFASWFDALLDMENQIDKNDFDIALLGCGSYGMSLASYIKQKGKIAVHLGGWLQFLFGIYGERWLNGPQKYRQLINESWIRPSKSETPLGSTKIEGNAYW